ncbi:MAG: gliding motility-associated protein GldL [Chitinophagaceae bacterium]|nr:gliding motility-associated protein GldL [Chitinophagaceae bacterium]
MAVAIPSKVSKVVDIFVSIAAAIVIWGALRKILHTSDADMWLKIGLTTEAIVFLVYGLLYLYFPAVSDPHMDAVIVPEKDKTNTALKSMEKMLQEADITPANLSKLSAGFQKLGTTVENMGSIGDAVAATGEYTQKTREAAQALTSVTTSYTTAATAMGAFSAAGESTKVYNDQVQVLTKNLSSLNTIYELELQESNNHLKSLNQFYGKLAEASAAMQNSADDAMKAQQQIAALASNLAKLNNIYGNMLSAMQGNR